MKKRLFRRDRENRRNRRAKERAKPGRRFETRPFILLYQIFRLDKIRIFSGFLNFPEFCGKNGEKLARWREIFAFEPTPFLQDARK